MCDDETPAFYREGDVKARKPHQCVECEDVIPVGETYLRASGRWNCEVRTYCTCLPCADMRRRLFRLLPVYDWPAFGQVEEAMLENDLTEAELYPDDIAAAYGETASTTEGGR